MAAASDESKIVMKTFRSAGSLTFGNAVPHISCIRIWPNDLRLFVQHSFLARQLPSHTIAYGQRQTIYIFRPFRRANYNHFTSLAKTDLPDRFGVSQFVLPAAWFVVKLRHHLVFGHLFGGQLIIMGCKLGNRTYDPSKAAINSHRPDSLTERQEHLWRLHNFEPFAINDGGQRYTIYSLLAYAYSTADWERARGESLYFCTDRRPLAHHSFRSSIQMERLSIKTPTSKSYFNAMWFGQI